MKKIILVSFLILLSTGFTYANDMSNLEVVRPRWTDFCPKGLENSEYKVIQQFLPDGSKSTQGFYNYWAERRLEFQKDLSKCDELPTDESKSSCYNSLRRRQLFVNEQYRRDVHMTQMKNQIWRDSRDKGSSPIMFNIMTK